MPKKKQPSMLSRIKELEEWKEEYPKKIDVLLTMINTYLVSKDPDLEKLKGVVGWYDQLVVKSKEEKPDE